MSQESLPAVAQQEGYSVMLFPILLLFRIAPSSKGHLLEAKHFTGDGCLLERAIDQKLHIWEEHLLDSGHLLDHINYDTERSLLIPLTGENECKPCPQTEF